MNGELHVYIYIIVENVNHIVIFCFLLKTFLFNFFFLVLYNRYNLKPCMVKYQEPNYSTWTYAMQTECLASNMQTKHQEVPGSTVQLKPLSK